MTALNEEELNFIFEYYTQKNQVENLDKYLSGQGKAEEKAEEKPSEKSETPKTENKEKEVSKSKTSTEKKVDKKPNTKTVINSKAENLKGLKNEEAKITVSDEQTVSSDARVVNTRTVDVNIDKYNENMTE